MTQTIVNDHADLRERLVDLLSDPLVDHRRAAAVVLGALEIADGAILDGLRRALRDEASEVRAAAAVALGRIGPKTLVKDLRPLLKDGVASVRSTAKQVLAEGPGVQVEELAKMLEGRDEKQRLGAIAVLGARGGREARTMLLGQLASGSPRVREAVVEALRPEVERLGADEIPGFVHEVDGAVDGLEEAGFEQAAEALVGLLAGVNHGAVTGVLARVAESGASTEIRVRAVEALRHAARGHRGAQEHVFKTLLGVVEESDGDAALLTACTDTLAEIDVPMAMEPRVRELTRATSTPVRRWAISALGSLDAAPAARALAATVLDGDPTDRSLAMEAAVATVHGRRALAKALVGLTDADRARTIASALEPHTGDLTKSIHEALEAAVVSAPAEVAEQIMRLLGGRGGAGHLTERAEQLKAAGQWAEAAELYRRIASDNDPEATFGLGVVELKMSKKTLGRGPSHDPAVSHFRKLTKHPKYPAVDKVIADPDLTPEDVYYLGFSLAEDKSDAVRTLGGDILTALAEGHESEPLGRKAQQKLRTMGWIE